VGNTNRSTSSPRCCSVFAGPTASSLAARPTSPWIGRACFWSARFTMICSSHHSNIWAVAEAWRNRYGFDTSCPPLPFDGPQTIHLCRSPTNSCADNNRANGCGRKQLIECVHEIAPPRRLEIRGASPAVRQAPREGEPPGRPGQYRAKLSTWLVAPVEDPRSKRVVSQRETDGSLLLDPFDGRKDAVHRVSDIVELTLRFYGD